jgi:hypothetical protein
MALHLSGVVFRRKWKPPQLKPWEGPFANPNQRLPQAHRTWLQGDWRHGGDGGSRTPGETLPPTSAVQR